MPPNPAERSVARCHPIPAHSRRPDRVPERLPSEGGALPARTSRDWSRPACSNNTRKLVDRARAVGRDDRARADHVPRRLQRDLPSTYGSSSVVDSTASSGRWVSRDVDSLAPQRATRRRCKRASTPSHDEPRLHPQRARGGIHDDRSRRLPDDCCVRVDDAHRYEKGYDVIYSVSTCVAGDVAQEEDAALKFNYRDF